MIEMKGELGKQTPKKEIITHFYDVTWLIWRQYVQLHTNICVRILIFVITMQHFTVLNYLKFRKLAIGSQLLDMVFLVILSVSISQSNLLVRNS